MGPPRFACAFFVYIPPPLPRCSSGAYSSLILPRHVSLPRKGRRVGLHIVLFEACSAFTRVAACTLARSPIRDPLSEGFRHFVASMPAPVASGWSESPGGACTHGKAPPCHGAHPNRTSLTIVTLLHRAYVEVDDRTSDRPCHPPAGDGQQLNGTPVRYPTAPG